MKYVHTCITNIWNTSRQESPLRERKRHTACRVVTTPSVVLTGYPPPWPGGGVPPWQSTPRQGTPPAGPGRVPPPPVSAPWHSGKCCKALWDMGTPPLWTDRWKDRRVSKHYLPVVLRTRAVKTNLSNLTNLWHNFKRKNSKRIFVSHLVHIQWNELEFSMMLNGLCLMVCSHWATPRTKYVARAMKWPKVASVITDRVSVQCEHLHTIQCKPL